MTHTCFFYGTLMAPPVLRRVIWGSQSPPTSAHAHHPLPLRSQPAILHGHQRHKVQHADYPAIVPTSTPPSPPPQQTSAVRGMLVHGLTDGDIWRLDIFEGSEYERRKVKTRVLQTGDHVEAEAKDKAKAGEEVGEEVEAETYVWIAGTYRLEPEPWDFDEFVREKMGRWIGKEAVDVDSGFQDVDEAMAAAAAAASRDPTGGRGLNGAIAKQLADDTTLQDEEAALRSAV